MPGNRTAPFFSPCIPEVTTSWAVLVTDPKSFLAEHVKIPASSGKVSAITRVQISSEKEENRMPHQSDPRSHFEEDRPSVFLL